MGRFISEDPLWGNIFDPQSLNRFAYGRNNPYKFVDPSGKAGESIGIKLLTMIFNFFKKEMITKPAKEGVKEYLKEKLVGEKDPNEDKDKDGISEKYDYDDTKDNSAFLKDSDSDGLPDCRDCTPNFPGTEYICEDCPDDEKIFSTDKDDFIDEDDSNDKDDPIDEENDNQYS